VNTATSERKAAGAVPLGHAERKYGWLGRARYAKRVRLGTYTMASGVILMLAGGVAPWNGVLLWLAGFVATNVGLLLRSRIRCRVCGLDPWTCRKALQVTRSLRMLWLAALEVCPVCGDDGSATPDATARWLSSGGTPEQPYWTSRRVVVALLLGVGCVGGGLVVAEWRKRSWAERLRESRRGPTKG